jgi:hypothetical protein
MTTARSSARRRHTVHFADASSLEIMLGGNSINDLEKEESSNVDDKDKRPRSGNKKKNNQLHQEDSAAAADVVVVAQHEEEVPEQKEEEEEELLEVEQDGAGDDESSSYSVRDLNALLQSDRTAVKTFDDSIVFDFNVACGISSTTDGGFFGNASWTSTSSSTFLEE